MENKKIKVCGKDIEGGKFCGFIDYHKDGNDKPKIHLCKNCFKKNKIK